MPINILMVCLGNICRSPLAEGILASKLPKDKFKVDSAGTGSWHIGRQPDERSIAVAKKHNLNISKQRGRQFTKNDFDTFDYIYVMDSSNYQDVMSLSENKSDEGKVKLILDELFPNEKVDVPDPYYGVANGFEIVFNMLNETCDLIAKKLIEKHT
ncbi:MAG TPA: low molecular weight protein-tyrosine-phosphatase [Flavobacterium sp.]|jgi:protein-tyrosine phosphatase|nr:low molecular weight protein-tyrosine-phosphatase [Flavobacterium sp.]